MIITITLIKHVAPLRRGCNLESVGASEESLACGVDDVVAVLSRCAVGVFAAVGHIDLNRKAVNFMVAYYYKNGENILPSTDKVGYVHFGQTEI